MACVFKGKEVLRFSSLWVIKAAEEGARISAVCRKLTINYSLYYILGNSLTSVS